MCPTPPNAAQTLEQLPGLGPKSATQLRAVGIDTPAQLQQLGAIRAFLRLHQGGHGKPSLNFLYALAGALEGEHWLTMAREEKGRLLTELEGYQELLALLKEEGLESPI